MIRVGLTGSLGAGKSTVARLFEEWGAFRIDADELAREAVRPGQPAFERIRESWGEAVVDAAGALDRSSLRRIVLRDPEARRRLERIVHPEVQKLRRRRREEARAAGARVVVEEIPLLFEAGLEGEFDVVVAVDAPEEVRRERLRRARGISRREFEAFGAAQLSPEEKRRRADHVIWNGGTAEELEAEARRAWAAILAVESAEEAADGAGASADAGSRPPRGTEGEEERPRGREGSGRPRGSGGAGGDALWAVDLHLHTRHSYDCLTEPRDVVRRARELRLHRIAVTDHNEIAGALAARDLAPELVILGEEVRTAEGVDLIGLFLSERIPPGGEFSEVAAAIRAQGGVVYLPHPFDTFRGVDRDLLETAAECVDIVEGFNARVLVASRNRRATEWARRHGLPVGAGSDAHLLSEIGRGRLLLPAFEGAADFLAAAAAGRVEGETSGVWVHLGSTWAKVRSALPL